MGISPTCKLYDKSDGRSKLKRRTNVQVSKISNSSVN